MPARADNLPTSSELDALLPPAPGSITLNDEFSRRIQIGVDHQFKALDYGKMVDFFRHPTNPFAAGEFWGKTVRAASLTYQYKEDPELKRILKESVVDLLSTQTPDGCISARTYPEQPKASDLWERKYVLLGLEGYYAIDPDPAVLNAMVRMADYTLAQIGPPPKTRIVDTGWAFYGIESSSILEPMVKLYNLTGHQRYLDFARYIVETEGACKRGSIFEAAARGIAPKDINSNGDPHQSIAKAYESMSCFEGLVEYYRVTGNDHWKEAALKYQAAIFDREITLIGSGGGDQPYNLGPGTGEQWNDTAYEQTNPAMTLMMETCVTVTWMKFCYQLLRLTGDSELADQIEISLYNALAGAQKQTGNYYDYHQMLNGSRPTKESFAAMIGNFDLSCCTANGPMGMALVPFTAVMDSGAGPVVNLYCFKTAKSRTAGGMVQLEMISDYPKSGAIRMVIDPLQASPKFTLRIRIPKWSAATALAVNGRPIQATPGTYATIDRTWAAGDVLDLKLDMRCRLFPAPHGSNRGGDNFVALMRGPQVFSRDLRLGGNIREPVDIQTSADNSVPLKPCDPAPFARLTYNVPTTDGGSFPVVDYASAGNAWNNSSEFVTWIPTPPNSRNLSRHATYAPHPTSA